MSGIFGSLERVIDAGHKAIETAYKDIGGLGYRIKELRYDCGLLTVVCHCPRKNEGSGESESGQLEGYKPLNDLLAGNSGDIRVRR